MNCPLCNTPNTAFAFNNRERSFYSCPNCKLIYVQPEQFLSAEEEKKRYSHHQNNREEGYLNFLNRVMLPALPFIDNTNHGLDYGCGPNDVLAQELRTAGYSCQSYDPYFKPEVLQPPYDFIFSTEVWEHFRNPKEEIEKVLALLKSGGVLALMTEIWTEKPDLHNWYYLNDPTHLCFFHQKTFDYLQKKYSLEMLYTDKKRVFIFRYKYDK